MPLPVVSLEILNSVSQSVASKDYLKKSLKLLKKENPQLAALFIAQKDNLKDAPNAEQLKIFYAMGFFSAYMLLRGQQEANEMNEVWS